MSRSFEDPLRLAELDHSTEIHDSDPRPDLPHHRQVVRDEDVREAELLLEDRSRLKICACTETSSAETGSSQTMSFGFQRERPCDADPLSLPAGELVRVAAGELTAEADDSRGSPLPGACFRWRRLVDGEGLPDDLLDRLARIERRVRVLEDHLHLPPKRPEWLWERCEMSRPRSESCLRSDRAIAA